MQLISGDDGQGRGQAHSLLQLSANPISSLCCALVATRSSSVSHQTGSFAPGGDASPSGRKLSGSNSSDDSPSPAAQYSGQQGASSFSQQHGNGANQHTDTAGTSASSTGWTFQGFRGPWNRPQHISSNLRGSDTQPAANTSLQHSLGVTGLWNWCEEIAVSGWAAAGHRAQGGVLVPSWGVTLSSYPDGAGDAWALSLRRCCDSSLTSELDRALTAELSLQKAMADGVLLTPGLVYARGPGSRLATLCCRTEWHF